MSYDLLRTRCNELLPERLELKFGCELEDREKHKIFRFLNSGNENTEDAWMTLLAHDGYITSGEGCPDFEILGPELTITDVLRVLGEKYAVDGSGFLLERQYGTSAYDCAGHPSFNLALPLSADENAAACEAVLALLDSKKV